MIVTLMRHYKVNYAWKKTYTAAEYKKAGQEYDKAEILDQLEPLTEDYHKIIISSLPRTLATLRKMKGDVKYISTPLLNEVPMEPFSHGLQHYNRHRLNIMARIQWMLNNSKQIETRIKTFERARIFIKDYLNADENCLIIGHRFFLRILSLEMLKQGFVGKLILRIENGERVTFVKKMSTQSAKINKESV